MKIDIAGADTIEINNAVFDFNGTIAEGGKISGQIKEKLISLAEIMPIYVITADTNNSAAKECKGLPLSLEILANGQQKANFIARLNGGCACFGNGFNDIEMFKAAALCIAVLGAEGLSPALLPHADILVKSIEEGIELLLKPNRIVADLRR